jgi:hypothetical protein
MAETSTPEALSAGVVPAPGWRARSLAVLSRVDFGEVRVVLALLALCVAVRLMRLQPIEFYDDEVTRWNFVRQWFHDNSFRHGPWTHHMARFGLNVPLFFTQALLGRHASVYYVWPVASFALQVLLTYLTAKRIGGRAAGVIAAILLSVFAGMDRGASQILPDAFGATAMILVVYLLIRYHDVAFERRLPWLFGSALAFVWAYEIKESNLLFLPGTALGVWLCRGRFRDGVWFTLVLFAAIALETLGFRLFTDYSSRFAIVGEAHGQASTTFWRLFERFTRLEPAWQMLWWVWTAAAVWVVGTGDRRAKLLVLLPAVFLFLLTFMVRSINPMIVWTRFFSRYFEPAAPLMVVVVALFAREATARAVRVNLPPRLAPLPTGLAGFSDVFAVGACFAVGLVEYAALDRFDEPALAEVRRISTITNDAYKRNLPIVIPRGKRGEPEERRARPLKLVYGIYLNPAHIVTSPLAKDGRLPDMLEVIRDTKRYSYVLRDPASYQSGQLEEWIERGCAVMLTEEKNHLLAAPGVPSLVVKLSQKLPASCRAPAR